MVLRIEIKPILTSIEKVYAKIIPEYSSVSEKQHFCEAGRLPQGAIKHFVTINNLITQRSLDSVIFLAQYILFLRRGGLASRGGREPEDFALSLVDFDGYQGPKKDQSEEEEENDEQN